MHDDLTAEGGDWVPDDRQLQVPPGSSRVGFLLGACWAQFKAHPGTVILNAFSFRLLFGALLAAGLVGAAVGSLISEAVGGVVAVAVFVPVWLLTAANPMAVLYCPYCRKRVKGGADVCHHCGRHVTPRIIASVQRAGNAARITDPRRSSSAQVIECPNCGSKYASDQRRCWHCGLETAAESSQATAALASRPSQDATQLAEPAPKPRMTVKEVAYALLGLWAIAGLIYEILK